MGNHCPTLLFACAGVSPEPWVPEIRLHFPELEIRCLPQIGDASEIDFVLLWKQPPGFLAAFPNLRCIYSMGMGVETILADPDLPAGVPVVRMVDPGLVIGMNEFVLMRVLHYHRDMVQFAAQQQQRQWRQMRPPLPQQRRVGILGLGELGGYCARNLIGLGFDVAGWSRTRRNLPGLKSFAGDAELANFLGRTEILVCMLPLTPATEDILSARTLRLLPRGACLINVARGRHLVEIDLLAALEEQHIAHATLDVFREEPLPAQHPFWGHEKICVVPHCSALTQPQTAAKTLAENLRGFLRGEPLRNVVDRDSGF